MAMTAQVKAELASTQITKTCCRKAEVASMLRYAGGLHSVSGRLVVEAEELARLAAHPLITIGSHTIDHVSLTDVSPENQRAQIDGGRRMLEEMISAPVTTFAYPYGRHDDITVGIVKALGLHLACTTHEGPATFRADSHRLPRLMVVDQSGNSFANWLRRSHGLARPALS